MTEHLFGLTFEHIRARRRRLEDETRKAFARLERDEKIDEAEDLEIRLRDELERKMRDYYPL